MAWYDSHEIRYRGRLVKITTRYGCLQDARVVKGKPLNFREGSRDFIRLAELFHKKRRTGQIEDLADRPDILCELSR